jgi:uncharacterized protein YkwD
MSLLPYDIQTQHEEPVVLYLPVPPPRQGTVGIFRREMYRLHNEVRRQAGLREFDYDPILQEMAQRQSGFMSANNLLQHTVDLGNVITRASYTWKTLGENVAYHTWTGDPVQTARVIFRGWMRSPGHRKNVLNPNFEDIGIGFWVSEWSDFDPGLGFSAAIFGTPLQPSVY